MEINAIKDRVKVKLDELLPLGEEVAHPIDSNIQPMLDESYLQLLREAPIHLLPAEDVDETVIYDTDNSIAYVPVPTDFGYRIVKFKFSDWTNEVRKFITTDSPEYDLIRNTNLGNRKVHPVIVLTHEKPTGATSVGRYLKCFDVDTDSSKEYLYYVKKDNITNLAEELIDPLTYLCAGKILETFENPNAKAGFERYMYFIQTNMI